MTLRPAPFRLRRLPGRYAGILLPFFLVTIMTVFVSGIATLRGVGLGPDFLGVWMQAWGLSWAAAFPIVVFVLPLVRKIVARLVEPPPG